MLPRVREKEWLSKSEKWLNIGCAEKSPVMLPIPGPSSLAHLEENLAAEKLQLSADEWKKIGELARQS
jgi:diketogulonate reductase-like aldo/keto reductase